jgi:sigma-E factor negative regulatory protein RseB
MPRSSASSRRTFRNVFPSLSAEQLRNLGQYYEARMTASERVAGHWTQVMSFEPKDGLRYGHKFWADANTGLLLKARVIDDRGEAVEQFTFTDVSINEKLDREMVKPSWATAPPDWQIKQGSFGDMVPKETGWSVGRLPGGFQKITEGYRTLRGKRDPVVHLVYSDGMVSISVFVESIAQPTVQTGLSQQGRAQRLRDEERRPPDNGAGRSAARGRSSDSAIGRPALTPATGST